MTTVTADAAGDTPSYEVTFATCSASEAVCESAKTVADDLVQIDGFTNTYKCEAATDNTCPKTTCGETSSSSNTGLIVGAVFGGLALLLLLLHYIRQRKAVKQNKSNRYFVGFAPLGSVDWSRYTQPRALQPEYNGLRNAV